MRKVSEENKRKYRSSLVGKTQAVLLEKIYETHGTGYGEHYVPVEVRSQQLQRNQFRQVEITGIAEGEDPPLLGLVI
jgi:tRNA A37 methylthiotransferase MiaB